MSSSFFRGLVVPCLFTLRLGVRAGGRRSLVTRLSCGRQNKGHRDLHGRNWTSQVEELSFLGLARVRGPAPLPL
jgi:hypothetical protein